MAPTERHDGTRGMSGAAGSSKNFALSWRCRVGNFLEELGEVDVQKKKRNIWQCETWLLRWEARFLPPQLPTRR